MKTEIPLSGVWRLTGVDADGSPVAIPVQVPGHVHPALEAAGVRVECDLRNEKIGKKIAEGRVQKIPYLLVIGDKEAENGSVAVRSRAGDEGAVALDEFIARIKDEIDTKKM